MSSAPEFDPKTTAIVVIDMHKGHLADNASYPCPRGRNAIQPLEKLLDEARKLKAHVVQVELTWVDGVHNRHPFWMGKDSLDPARSGILRHNIVGTEMTDFVVKPKPGDYVINTKRTLSCFMYTDLELYLRKFKIETVAIAGVMSEVCCLSTAFDAFNRHYKVVALTDCQGGENEYFEQAAYKIVDRNLGWAMTSTQFLQTLRKAPQAVATVSR